MRKLVVIFMVLISTYYSERNISDVTYKKYEKIDIDHNLVIALGNVERNLRNVVLAKRIENQAYRYFQIIPPAVDEIKVYKTEKVNKAEELLKRYDLQVEHCILHIKYLIPP